MSTFGKKFIFTFEKPKTLEKIGTPWKIVAGLHIWEFQLLMIDNFSNDNQSIKSI